MEGVARAGSVFPFALVDDDDGPDEESGMTDGMSNSAGRT